MTLFHQIMVRGDPFPQPLPVPVEELIALFGRHGIEFTTDDKVLLSREVFEASRLAKVKSILTTNRIAASASETFWKEYDERDFTEAPLWQIGGVPEIRLPGVRAFLKCPECGRARYSGCLTERLTVGSSTLPIVAVNGEFLIARRDVAAELQAKLKGVHLHDIDGTGNLSALCPLHTLRKLVFRPGEVIDFQGRCKSCDAPLFKTNLGPPTYPLAQWNSEDIVICDILGSIATTRTAFELLRSFEPVIHRRGTVRLVDSKELASYW